MSKEEKEITTKQIDEIIDVVLDYVEVLDKNTFDDAHPDISASDRNKLISIIRDIVEGE